MALLMAGIMVLAVNLRAAISSLPPVFPDLASALHLSPASIAVLAAVPVLCFGLFSSLAAPLSRRFGEERVLLAALLLLAGGLLLRGAWPGSMLYPGTVLAGGSIALMNVLLPSLVKRRRPQQAGLLIGSYLLTLSGGAVVASLIAVPVLRAAGGLSSGSGWPIQLTLGLWALPALVAAVVWLPQARYRTKPPGPPGPGPGGEAGRCGRGPDGRVPARARLAGRRVHGAAEHDLLRHAVLAAHVVPGPGRERGERGRPARPDELRQRGHRHVRPPVRPPGP
jgi:CP family cyanate transporter-like MFS transporter